MSVLMFLLNSQWVWIFLQIESCRKIKYSQAMLFFLHLPATYSTRGHLTHRRHSRLMKFRHRDLLWYMTGCSMSFEWWYDMGYGIWDMGYGICDMGYWILDMGYGIWDMEYVIWDMGYGIWDMEYGIWDMEYGMWNMGCGIWDMGYGIWIAESWLSHSVDIIPDMHYIIRVHSQTVHSSQIGRAKTSHVEGWELDSQSGQTNYLQNWYLRLPTLTLSNNRI